MVFVYKELPDCFQEQLTDVKTTASLITASLEPSQTSFQWQCVNLRTCLTSFFFGQLLLILNIFMPEMGALLPKSYFDKEANTKISTALFATRMPVSCKEVEDSNTAEWTVKSLS